MTFRKAQGTTLCVNIVVMWIVLIRENVTAGVSGRIDKGTEKRLEMMWCQHGCHSCKEQEVYNAVRTTQLHTVTTETIDTLQEEGGVAYVSEADRDAMEAREDFWSMSSEFIYDHHVVPSEQLYLPEESLTS